MAEIPARSLADAPATLDIGQAEKRRPGRPEIVSDEWKWRILDEIADGKLLTKLCQQEGWPSRTTVYRWFAADPEFWKTYRTCAREMGAEAFAERAWQKAQEAEDAGLGMLAWRASTWHAAKMNPDRFGDRLNLRRDEKPPEEMDDEELSAIAAGGGPTAAEAAGG